MKGIVEYLTTLPPVRVPRKKAHRHCKCWWDTPSHACCFCEDKEEKPCGES